MGKFIRENLPEPIGYYEAQGLVLKGKGTWRTTRCDFHGGSDSMGININNGGFICRAGCGARGGDVMAYHRAAHGKGFIETAIDLGAWDGNGKADIGSNRPTSIPARQLLELASNELTICVLVLSDSRNGLVKDADFNRLCAAVGRVNFISEVANGHR